MLSSIPNFCVPFVLSMLRRRLTMANRDIATLPTNHVRLRFRYSVDEQNLIRLRFSANQRPLSFPRQLTAHPPLATPSESSFVAGNSFWRVVAGATTAVGCDAEMRGTELSRKPCGMEDWMGKREMGYSFCGALDITNGTNITITPVAISRANTGRCAFVAMARCSDARVPASRPDRELSVSKQ
ncbi:hypothetical protein R3P38DRAFT_3168294 [Favolaschia claudopus]|uniref:Uncharacterized protein n=1 Tax=Favolaschia claudopus TaxID=2862362 RepID=A0AAW0E5D3_9AGAR